MYGLPPAESLPSKSSQLPEPIVLISMLTDVLSDPQSVSQISFSGSQLGAVLSPRGHLAMSRDVFDGYTLGWGSVTSM